MLHLKKLNILMLLLLSVFLLPNGNAVAQQFELLYNTPVENSFISVVEEDSSFLLIGNQGKMPNFTPHYLRISKSGVIELDSLDQSIDAAVIDIIDFDSTYLLVYNSSSLDSLWGMEVDKSLKKIKRIRFTLKDSIDPWFYFNGKLSNDKTQLVVTGAKSFPNLNFKDGFTSFIHLDSSRKDTVVFANRPARVFAGSNAVVQMGDGKYYVTGTIRRIDYPNSCNTTIELTRYNADFSLDTNFAVCGEGDTTLGWGFHFRNSMTQLTDSTFAIASVKQNDFDNQRISEDVAYTVLDTNFKEINSFVIFKPDSFAIEGSRNTDKHENSNSFYVGGTERYIIDPSGYNDSNSYFLLRRADLEGNEICTRLYSNSSYLNLKKVLATSDGGALMIGTSYDEKTANGLENDVWIVKVDSNCNYKTITSLGDNPFIPQEDFAFFPNPFKEQITFRQFNQSRKLQMQLFDLQGRKILEKQLWESQVEIDLSGLSRGTYLYRLLDEKGKTASGKIVKQ